MLGHVVNMNDGHQQFNAESHWYCEFIQESPNKAGVGTERLAQALCSENRDGQSAQSGAGEAVCALQLWGSLWV